MRRGAARQSAHRKAQSTANRVESASLHHSSAPRLTAAQCSGVSKRITSVGWPALGLRQQNTSTVDFAAHLAPPDPPACKGWAKEQAPQAPPRSTFLALEKTTGSGRNRTRDQRIPTPKPRVFLACSSLGLAVAAVCESQRSTLITGSL